MIKKETSIQQKVDKKKLKDAKDRLKKVYNLDENIKITNGEAAILMVRYFADDSNFKDKE